MDTLYISARPALRKFYRVAGRSLLLDAHDEGAARTVARFFDAWYFAPAGEDAADLRDAPDATIRLRGDAPAPAPPRDLAGFELPGGGHCRTDGAAFFITFGDSLITLRGDCSAEVSVWLGAGLREGSLAFASVISYAASAALRRCGVFELHSGGVRDPSGGGGALIVGASGSGKSTLTLQLAAAGWNYLSDDVMLLGERGGRVEASGLRRDFAVTERTLAASGLASFQTSARAAFDPDKLRLPPTDFFPAGHVETCEPAALFFPSVTGEAETRVEELPQAAAMARLIRMCPWASYDTCAAERHLGVLARLARQCDAFAVRAGTDLLEDPSLAARVLAPRLRRP